MPVFETWIWQIQSKAWTSQSPCKAWISKMHLNFIIYVYSHSYFILLILSSNISTENQCSFSLFSIFFWEFSSFLALHIHLFCCMFSFYYCAYQNFLLLLCLLLCFCRHLLTSIFEIEHQKYFEIFYYFSMIFNHGL